jgi:hypothetical protein
MTAFLAWSLLFWPIALACEYVFTKHLGSAGFLQPPQFFSFVLFVIWCVGISKTFRVYRLSKGVTYAMMEDESEADEMNERSGRPHNTLFIIEAPTVALAESTKTTYLEYSLWLSELPKIGTRIALDHDFDDLQSVGIVVEAAQCIPTAEDIEHCVWIELVYPDDYIQLELSDNWDEGTGTKVRFHKNEVSVL